MLSSPSVLDELHKPFSSLDHLQGGELGDDLHPGALLLTPFAWGMEGSACHMFIALEKEIFMLSLAPISLLSHLHPS